MARLIVESGDSRKAYSLKSGKVTVGSGEGCSLSFPESDLAEVHAELECSPDEVVLRLKKGVQAARAGGRSVQGEHTFAHGKPVKLSSLSLTVEYEGKAAESLVARRGQPGRAAQARTGGRTETGAGGRPAIQRQRRTVQRGLPTWVVALIVVISVGVLYKALTGFAGGISNEGFDEGTSYNNIAHWIDIGETLSAAAELKRVNARPELKQGWREKFDSLQVQLDEVQRAKQLAGHNARGTEFLQTQLKNYEAVRLKKPERAKVRVFLKRARAFREIWPEHPELDWITRREERYNRIVKLSDPPTYDDIAFEVETLTWAKPRDYRKAFSVVDAFLSSASPDDRLSGQDLRDKLLADEKEYYQWCIEEAAYKWKEASEVTGGGKLYGESVEWLVQCVVKLNDQELIDGAADRLLQIPDIDQRWGGYRESRPEQFAVMASHPRIKERLQEIGQL